MLYTVSNEVPPVVKLKVGLDAFLLDVEGVWCKLLYPIYQDNNGAWYYVIRKGDIEDDKITARVQNCFMWDIVGYDKEEVLKGLY